jgi:hypothetical protein
LQKLRVERDEGRALYYCPHHGGQVHGRHCRYLYVRVPVLPWTFQHAQAGAIPSRQGTNAMTEPPPTQYKIAEVCNGVLSRRWVEIKRMSKDDLEKQWYFFYNKLRTKDQNVYDFHRALADYTRTCRDWETHHHGMECVIERVRDQYLMPRIKAFLAELGVTP